MTSIERFTPTFSSDQWEDLRFRLGRTRWPDQIGESDWDNGLELQSLKDLCRFWSEDFDWQKHIGLLSQFPHYHFHSDQGNIHFLHVKGRGPAAIPLIMTHGWPGSFLEMLEIIPLLTNPADHGLSADISFDLVIPSLPGFGFSDRPQIEGVNSFRVAEIWVQLMQALGYDRFAAQGGDIGAGVSTALGLRHGQHLIGIHLNYIPGSYKPYLAPGAEITAAERQFQVDAARWYDENGAYAHLQATRPQTPAYALNDSPAGLAAWILEKFREWSDCGGDLYSSFSRDTLLANVTLYWMTQTIVSSFGMYREGRQTPLHFSSTDYVSTPCAIACFPKEIMVPPRSWVERGYNVTRWTTMPRGGHFAASEEPGLLASDLQAFFSSLRT